MWLVLIVIIIEFCHEIKERKAEREQGSQTVLTDDGKLREEVVLESSEISVSNEDTKHRSSVSEANTRKITTRTEKRDKESVESVELDQWRWNASDRIALADFDESWARFKEARYEIKIEEMKCLQKIGVHELGEHYLRSGAL